MANEYYTQIGIEPEASEQEIRLAVAQKRREYTIARDDEKLSNLGEISKTLRDPDARKEYDILQKHGEVIVKYIEAADEAHEKGDFDTVISNLRRANALLPSDSIENRIAIALGRLHRHREAIVLYERLIAAKPDCALYLRNGSWAYVYMGMSAVDASSDAECPHCKKNNLSGSITGAVTINCRHCRKAFDVYVGDSQICLVKAKTLLDKAITVDPYNEEPLLELADVEGILGHTERARELVYTALRLDGVIGPADLNSYVKLMRIYARAEDYDQIKALGWSMRSEIATTDEGFWPYAQVAIIKEFADDYEAKAYKLMAAVFAAVEALGPLDNDMRGWAHHVRTRHAISEQALKVIRDDACDKGLVELVRILYCFDEEIEVEQLTERERQLNQYFATKNSSQRTTALSYLQRIYPAIWEDMQERIKKILSNIPAPAGSSYSSNYSSGSSSSTASSGSGCILGMLLVAGALVSPFLLVLTGYIVIH